MINSTSNLSFLFSGQNQINQLKLYQALGTGYGSYSSTLGTVGTLKKQSLSQEESSFLKTYQTKMTNLQNAAQNARNVKADKTSAMAVDSGVAQASGKLSKVSDTYTLRVESLASTQVNRSNGFTKGNELPAMGGLLKLTVGGKTSEIGLSSAGAKDNKEMLEGFAKKINDAKTGVTASVKEKDGLYTLELEGEEGRSFTASGTIAERLGLDTAAQAAQKAVYTASRNGGAEERYESSTNKVTIDGLDVTLKSAGTTEIKAGTDLTTAKGDAVQKLVDSYNDALKFLNNNADQGIGVLKQMKNMLTLPVSEGSMRLIGVEVNNDGTMTFDRAQFNKVMNSENPTLYNSIMDNMARGIEDDALRGQRMSSASLLSAQRSQAESDNTQSPYNAYSTYTRSGIQTLLNLNSLGAFMSINI